MDGCSFTDLWNLHPRGNYFIARGGDRIPPPRHINLTLTNKCNLRCEICGSQKTLDKAKTPRSHMAFATFEQIAEAVFPFLFMVELNSLGDPLLYPRIEQVLETVARHQCALRVQHNGTRLTDLMIEHLVAGHGTISLSIDAVGPLFDQVRRNAVWEKVEPGVKKLIARRDPRRTSVVFYSTITQRTVSSLLDIVRWAQAHEVDSIVFHDYQITEGSSERRSDNSERERQFENIFSFLTKANSALRVAYDSRTIYPGRLYAQREAGPSPIKAKHAGTPHHYYPMEADHTEAHPEYLCLVPWGNLAVDIEGQLSACCRSTQFPFGGITNVESFADIWFGENFQKLRNSLRREPLGPLPLPACDSCIRHYAPIAAGRIQQVTYTNNRSCDGYGLTYNNPEAHLVSLVRERAGSNSYRARIPLGVVPSEYVLFEDHSPLGPVSSREDVIDRGQGRYCFSGNTIYFSASDSTDPLRNGYTYVLRRR